MAWWTALALVQAIASPAVPMTPILFEPTQVFDDVDPAPRVVARTCAS